MRVLHLSYSRNSYSSPDKWLERINFFTGILEKMTPYCSVSNISIINYSGHWERKGVDYHFLKLNRLQILFPVQLHLYIKKHIQPDVVVVHGLLFPFQTLILKWQLGKRVKIVAQHHAEQPFRGIRKYLQKIADRCIELYFFASAEFGERWHLEGIIKDKKKIKEVMEVSSLFYPIERAIAQHKTNIRGENIYLWVGRLDANKDPLLVIRAFIRLAQSQKTAKLFLIFQEEHLLSQIQEIIDNSPEALAAITLVGKVDHQALLYWYNSADFIISTSHYEGSGVAVCEAMSCGCIPILTDIPSFRMMTRHGAFGFLFEPGNEAELFSVLEKSIYLGRSAERRKVLSFFNQKLSFEAIAKTIYLSVCPE